MESVGGVAAGPEGGGEEIDPWGGEDEIEQSPSARSQDLPREWEARRLQFHNLGYRDGITAGNNSSVQEGFNVGFHEAVEPGFSWGVVRGAASAYSSLPPKLKELLLKDREAGKRLESLDATLSDISSSDAMGMYYTDTVLARKGVTAEDSLQKPAPEVSQSSSLAEIQIEDEAEANACCGRKGSCGDSGRACSSEGVDDDGVSATALRQSTKPISEEAYNLILRVGTSSSDARQLELSTTSHLGSMALGHPAPSASSTSRASEPCSRLELYQRNVRAELDSSPAVQLSCFPRHSQA